MIPLFEVGEPAEPPGLEAGSGRREADRCRRCHRPLKDAVSLGYHIGPDCRKALGITGRSSRLRARRGRVRGWKPGDEQYDLLDQNQEIDGKECVMAFIDEGDSPELLKATVNGKPGFVVFPQGEDQDGIYFTSVEALDGWVAALIGMAAVPEDAQPYEEWLDMYHQDGEA